MADHRLRMRTMPPECYTIDEFCESHGLGRSNYYELRKKGLAPQEFRIGTRWLITKESAQRWRAARDAEAAGRRRKAGTR
jgi:predicted DNA-binding transcriptional regulator AlpA